MGMKVAVLISGSPRFNEEFDTFISGLQGCSQVDWFIQLWKDNPRPDKLGYEDLVLVADSWRHVDQQWAETRIVENLPTAHKLVKLTLTDTSSVVYPTITGPQVHHSNFESICKMHLGWNIVDRLRQEHTEEYDLVIRARPDLCLPGPLNLPQIRSIINQHPNTVVVSNGGQHGYQYFVNDLIAITSPKNMSIYTDLVNHVKEYNDRQVVFHPENLLACHLITNGLKIMPLVRAEIRQGTINFGRWG
jgi:hypothetical protein